jgi:hypothetical protein
VAADCLPIDSSAPPGLLSLVFVQVQLIVATVPSPVSRADSFLIAMRSWPS